MGTTARLVIGTIVGLIVLYLLGSAIGALLGLRFVWGTVGYVVDNLASRSGISVFLVRGVVIIATIPFFMAVAKFTGDIYGLLTMGWNSPLGFYSKGSGLVVVLYISGFFVAMYYSSLDALAYKFCATTPEGIFTADGPGKDPVYGIETAPCNVDQIKTLRNKGGKLQGPQEIHIPDVTTYAFFNGVTGQPAVWYSVLPNGDYRFFDRPGSDPATGVPLQPITHDVVDKVRQSRASASDDAELRSLVLAAQHNFDAGSYQDAKDTCDRVLKKSPTDENAKTIRQHACVKLAQDLVKKGQLQGEKGQFDEAIWNAREAMKLDPTNPSAPKLEEFAQRMKPRSLN